MLTVKRLLTVGATIALAVALTGCLSIRGDIKLDRQANASGDVTIEINKQLAGLAGITSADQLRDQYAKDTLGDAKVSETDTSYKITGPIKQRLDDPNSFLATVEDVDPSTQTLSSLPTSPHRLHFRVNLSNDQSTTSTDPSEDMSGLNDIAVGSIDLTVHFPGKVEAVTPATGWEKVDDRTYRINAQLTPATMSQPFEAFSAIDPPKPVSQRLLPILIVVAVLIPIGLAAALLWRRSRRHPPSETPTPSEPSELIDQ